MSYNASVGKNSYAFFTSRVGYAALPRNTAIVLGRSQLRLPVLQNQQSVPLSSVLPSVRAQYKDGEIAKCALRRVQEALNRIQRLPLYRTPDISDGVVSKELLETRRSLLAHLPVQHDRYGARVSDQFRELPSLESGIVTVEEGIAALVRNTASSLHSGSLGSMSAYIAAKEIAAQYLPELQQNGLIPSDVRELPQRDLAIIAASLFLGFRIERAVVFTSSPATKYLIEKASTEFNIQKPFIFPSIIGQSD